MNKCFGISLLGLLVFSCNSVPITNRKQLSLLPESQLIGMGLTEYKSFLSQHPAVSGVNANSELVKRVGGKIQVAVGKFFQQKGLSSRLSGYNWEFNLVNSPEANAWCMPGGKVVVYSGLLPITQDENSLAFVMGHEIAHAVARHGNERMSESIIAEAGALALDTYLQIQQSKSRNLFNQAYAIGTQVGVMLPFSRTHESEADKMGMVFMALAGYDPGKSPEFWKRMAAHGGKKPPEFLSTHPSDATRQKAMQDFLPEAMKYYKKPQ
jgi:predicted Zn-dependent protease